MGEEGKSILLLVKEIRKLCENIASLLGTTDQLVDAVGWVNATSSSSVTSGNSTSLNSPQYWFPETFYRFYKNKRYPNILLYVAIVLDNRENHDSYPATGQKEFAEPILTAGYCNYGENSVGNEWEVWHCKGHFFYTEDPSYDGQIYTTSRQESWHTSWGSLVSLHSLALPLVAVANATELKEKVVDPLFASMR